MSDKRAQNFSIFVPDLFWPEPDDQAALKDIQCPHLEKLLARTPLTQMTRENGGSDSPESVLFDLAGLSQSLASIRALGEDNPLPISEGAWLCADPVHLRFHHEQIVLADPGAFVLTQDEATQLVTDLNAMFADIGQFFAPHPERWYVRLHPDHGAFTTTELLPLSAVAGRRLQGETLHSQQGTENQISCQRRVRQWQNEIQMWLHAHPLNELRLSAGKPAINGLWFWGSRGLSTVPDARQVPFSRIYSYPHHVLARGLAKSNALPWETLAGMKADGVQKVNALLVWDDLVKPTLYEDAAAWRAAVESFDREWLAPLLAGKTPFTLVISSIYGTFRLNSCDYRGWQFWKPIKPLGDIVQNLALARS